MPKVRLLLVDDHRLFRDALRGLIDAEGDLYVVGEAGDAFEGARLVRALHPDLILLDMAMPGTTGVEAAQVILAEVGCGRVLLLTAAVDRADLVHALQLGARGVVMKDAGADVLLRAIHGVMAGQYWVGRERIADLVAASRALFPTQHLVAHDDFGLTAREMQIVASVVAAYPNRDIAHVLGISEKTVKHHLTNVFDKVGVSNRLELALFALHRGLKLPALPALADTGGRVDQASRTGRLQA